MPFPLGEWIDSHERCRYNLGSSGMWGAIRRPPPGRPGTSERLAETLVDDLADHLGVGAERLFLTHGATEANSWVMLYLRPRPGDSDLRARVRLPEYPPLAETARWAGFRVGPDPGPVRLAVVSRPRNPEGDLWGAEPFARFAEDATSVLVDETFREFAGVPSLARDGRPDLWVTGTLTKFYAGDDIRVGWVVAPPEAAAEFARFHGNVADQVPDHSLHLAVATVRAHRRIARDVARILEPNRAAWHRAFPGRAVPVGPVGFDRTAEDGTSLARRCLAASVLVSPGEYFGESNGVRIGMTRPTFARDLARYLAVRDRAEPTARPRRRSVRRPRAASDRGPAARA